ncbi:MAG: D-lyxose/D-mannose family sugar isomerase [bacterium]|nr:D-lyxose/D-mannose family sugar isomerase [bacterium]
MITREQQEKARLRAIEYLDRAGIVLTEKEKQNIEVADMGLNDLGSIGLELITYVNTERVCAKELILFPRQSCPEHRHPPVNGEPGKEETFRCRWGQVYLYVQGEPTPNPKAIAPKGHENWFTVWHEIILNPGEQYTLLPDILHWFQAGDEGAIISEFSTRSRDESDIFTDPEITRAPEVVE